MNPRNSNLQYIALMAVFLLVSVGIYLVGSTAYYETSRWQVDISSGTSTITVTTERLARLEQEAAIGRRLQRVQDALVSTSTSIANIAGTTTPYQADVIGRPPQSPYDTLVLNIGNDVGVEIGAPVWWPPGLYLGEVVDVRESTSVVQLISSPSVQHPVFIRDIPFVTEGRGGDELYAEVPDGIDITVGDTVLSDIYEVPIGVVSAVRDVSTTDQQALYISRFISSSVIQHVYVQR